MSSFITIRNSGIELHPLWTPFKWIKETYQVFKLHKRKEREQERINISNNLSQILTNNTERRMK